MKSYPQALCTGVQKVWDTPNAMRKVIQSLTDALRFFREKRTASAVSSLKRKKRLWASIAILAVTSTTGITKASAANYSIDHLKLYAHSHLTQTEMRTVLCFVRPTAFLCNDLIEALELFIIQQT